MKTVSDWRLQFESLPHRLAGEAVQDLQARRQTIESLLKTCPQISACFLQEADPVQFSLCYFTLLDYGFLPIPVSPEISDSQKEIFLTQYPKALWWCQGVLKNQSQADHSSIPYQNSYACLTSGTTSTPKLCYLSVTGAQKNARAHAESFKLHSGLILRQSLPVYHSFGLVCYLWTSVLVGMPIDFNLIAPGFTTVAERYDKNSVVYLSPAQLRFFARQKNRPIPRVGIASIGGGAISSQEVALFKDLFPHSQRLVSYGLTEAGPRVSSGEATASVEGSYIGRALPGTEVYILTEKAELLTEGEGLLCIKSPSLKLNLLDHELAAPGILRTRDHVILKNGHISFLSRADDLIKVGGVSVYPADIENAARSLQGVTDCIVLKYADPLYEEIPVLAVEGDIELSVLQDQLGELLPPGQMPKRLYVLAKLPRQSLNKIDRRELLKMLETL